MAILPDLLVPIVAAAAAVWIYSAIAWMVLPHHRSDFKGLPDEDGFMGVVRSMGVPPGNYTYPHCHSKAQRNDPAFAEKWKAGPMGTLSVWPPMSMGRNMLLTFVVYVIVSGVVAYLGWATLEPGASFGRVFQVLGTAGVLGYAFAFIPNGIWFNHGRAIFTNVLDGLVSGLITGAMFAWLWPGA